MMKTLAGGNEGPEEGISLHFTNTYISTLGGRQCSEHFTYINSIIPHNSSMSLKGSLSSFYYGEIGTKALRDLPKLESGKDWD